MFPTRQDYMSGKVTHEEYYVALAKTCGVSYDNADPAFMARVVKALDEGGIHLNSIPLQEWDMRGALIMGVAKAFKEHGDFDSLAGRVCLIKTAAKRSAMKHST